MSPFADQEPSSGVSRREFLKETSVAAAATAAGLAVARAAYAAGSDTLKAGLVGCGGRGTGAAANALSADPNCKLTALADAFADRVQNSLSSLKAKYGDRVAVDADHCFSGFDGYQKLIQSGVDVVLLAEPPHFRPSHLKACIDAGKHVFCEKPVAVDAPGIRSVMATADEAEKKGLSIVSGLCWRYHPGVQETMKRVLDGAIGQVLAIQETYLTGPVSQHLRKPEWTEMEYQLRNWYYFTWLSGDFNVEQHVHSLDKGSWLMGDQPPAQAWGIGGRQVRTDPQFGQIYDHFAVVYEYANGVRMHAYCRQIPDCWPETNDLFTGSKGHCSVLKGFRIEGENPWHYQGPGGNMYELEHQALFQAIRSGKPINNGRYMATSTMLAILGRMCGYTGGLITWEQAISSQQTLAPAKYAFDADPPVLPGPDGKYPVAMPGITKLT